MENFSAKANPATDVRSVPLGALYCRICRICRKPGMVGFLHIRGWGKNVAREKVWRFPLPPDQVHPRRLCVFDGSVATTMEVFEQKGSLTIISWYWNKNNNVAYRRPTSAVGAFEFAVACRSDVAKIASNMIVLCGSERKPERISHESIQNCWFASRSLSFPRNFFGKSRKLGGDLN